MQNVALLLTAIASIISAFGGVIVGLVALRGRSLRERESAAESAAERMLQPPTVDTASIVAAVEEFYRHQPPAEGKEAKPE